MREACTEFVDKCEHCQRFKSRTQRSFGTMAEVEEPESMGIAYSIDFLTALAAGRARDAPQELQESARHHWKRRWANLVSVAGKRAFADTLLNAGAGNTELWEGAGPTLGQLLGDEPHAAGEGDDCSRLPLRS